MMMMMASADFHLFAVHACYLVVFLHDVKLMVSWLMRYIRTDLSSLLLCALPITDLFLGGQLSTLTAGLVACYLPCYVE
jgi:hypothetical protein